LGEDKPTIRDLHLVGELGSGSQGGSFKTFGMTLFSVVYLTVLQKKRISYIYAVKEPQKIQSPADRSALELHKKLYKNEFAIILSSTFEQ
jgi:hypothetical protein